MPPSMASTVLISVYWLVHMTCCVTEATPIQFIDGNKLKSCRMGLTNHTWPISHNITPLVINGFGGRHRDTHILTACNKNDFKAVAPDLKIL